MKLDASANDNVPALARFNTGSIVLICSLAFRPDIAKIFRPSAASVALNEVVSPSSFAFSVSGLIWSTVLPIVAANCELAVSKSLPTFILAVATAVAPAT